MTRDSQILRWPFSSRRSRTHRFISLLVATLLLAGCSIPSSPRGSSDVGQAVDAQLKRHTQEGKTTLDFDELVPGRWKELLIVCYGTNREATEKSLGFSWLGPRDQDPFNRNFLAMLVFSSGTKVEKFFSVGQDDSLVDHWYFSPCSSPVENSYHDRSEPIKLERDSAVLDFIYYRYPKDESLSFWYVPTEKLDELEAGSAVVWSTPKP